MVTNAPTRKRRWLRISLRTLLVLLTLGCIWLGVVFNRVHRQARAVKAIEAAGGTISFDYHLHIPWPLGMRRVEVSTGCQDAPPPAPEWLLRLAEHDLFRTPEHVELRGEAIDDAFLAEHLRGMSRLQWLEVESPRVTDAGIEHIARLPNVDWLRLRTPAITDAALVHIGRMEQLKLLELNCPQITDEGVRHLANLRELWCLKLNSPHITPAGLEYLHTLDQLDTLTIVRDPLNKDLIQALARWTALEFVEMPLADVLEFLALLEKQTFAVDRISEDDLQMMPVNCHMRAVPLQDGLDAMLDPLDLGYYLDAGTIVIAPRDEADAMRPGYRAFREALPNVDQVFVDW